MPKQVNKEELLDKYIRGSKVEISKIIYNPIYFTPRKEIHIQINLYPECSQDAAAYCNLTFDDVKTALKARFDKMYEFTIMEMMNDSNAKMLGWNDAK